MNRPFTLASFSSAGVSAPLSTVGTDIFSTNGKSVVQCTATGTGAGAVSVVFEGSLDGIGWVPLVTFSITAVTGNPVSDGAYIDFLWFFVRARCTSLPSGTRVDVTIYREE